MDIDRMVATRLGRPRGRPPTDWTPKRQELLLRLYLCTPESDLTLDEILGLLTDGDFKPRIRQAQTLLRSLLSSSYRRRRPKTRQGMKKRIDYLKYVRRASSRQMAPARNHASASPLLDQNAQYTTGSIETDMRPSLPVGDVSSIGGSLDIVHIGSKAELSTSRNMSVLGPIGALMSSPQISGSSVAVSERNFTTGTTKLISSVQFPGEVSINLEEVDPGSPWSAGSPLNATVQLALDSDRDDETYDNETEGHDSIASFLSARLKGSRAPSFLADISTLFGELSHRWGTQSAGDVSIKYPSSPPMSTSEEIHTFGIKEEESSIPDAAAQNVALISFCCSKPNKLSSSSLCIHKRIAGAIKQKTFDSLSLTGLNISKVEANSTDSLGNSLLHVVARWGAPLSILKAVLEMVENVGAVNIYGQTFLHVLDGLFMSSISLEDFPDLIKMLKSRGFNFHARDRDGRTFLLGLILKPCWPPESLEGGFRHLGEENVRVISRYRDRHGLTLLSWLQKLARQSENQIDWETACYADYLIQRYCGGLDTVWSFTAPLDGQGRNILQQVVAAMNTNKQWPCKMVMGGAWIESTDFVEALEALTAQRLDVTNHETDSGRTPLMTLILRLTASQHPDQTAERLVHYLTRDRLGLDERDQRGNTALHYAATLGVSPAVKILCERGADIELRNECGYTPLDILTRKLRTPRGLQKAGLMKAFARHLECAMILVSNDALFDRREGVRAE